MARTLGIREDLLRDAEKQLHSIKREDCQRTVVEHRLRLALNAKNLDEIERSVRQVRALGHIGLIEDSGAAGFAGGSDRTEPTPPHSARLMDAASSMMRHL